MLQLRHGLQHESIRVPGTLDALDQLLAAELLREEDYALLSDGYRFLRNAEARIRLMNTAARHELPEDVEGLMKLARLMHCGSPEEVEDRCRDISGQIRACFDRYVDSSKAAAV